MGANRRYFGPWSIFAYHMGLEEVTEAVVAIVALKVFPEQKKSFVDTFFLKNWQHSLVLWQMPVVNFKVEFRAQKIEARVVSGGVGGLVHDLRSPKWSRNKLLLALGCFVYELEALLVSFNKWSCQKSKLSSGKCQKGKILSSEPA